jgi:hypothetical protein
VPENTTAVVPEFSGRTSRLAENTTAVVPQLNGRTSSVPENTTAVVPEFSGRTSRLAENTTTVVPQLNGRISSVPAKTAAAVPTKAPKMTKEKFIEKYNEIKRNSRNNRTDAGENIAVHISRHSDNCKILRNPFTIADLLYRFELPSLYIIVKSVERDRDCNSMKRAYVHMTEKVASELKQDDIDKIKDYEKPIDLNKLAVDQKWEFPDD